jgi:general secretion pathway protein G
MMVVIFIIGMITAIVAINVLPSQDVARAEKARADIRLLEQALELYRLDRARYPSTEEGLQALVTPPPAEGGVIPVRKDPYIRRLPRDPWNRDYVYVAPGANGAFDLYSLGADAAEGGEGPDADIVNWRN